MRHASSTIKSLWEFASIFREVLVKSDRSSCHLSLRDFPRGACGDASLLLIEALADRGVEAAYMLGYNNHTSHAWVRVDDIDMDITADQFCADNPKVIVVQKSHWHRKFRPTSLEKRLRDYASSLCGSALEALHQEIAKEIRSYNFILLSPSVRDKGRVLMGRKITRDA